MWKRNQPLFEPPRNTSFPRAILKRCWQKSNKDTCQANIRDSGKKALIVIEKYESRRIRVEIRRVLLTVWDPIGIRDESNAQDEYDGYLGGVF
jgi:hypothetical protein